MLYLIATIQGDALVKDPLYWEYTEYHVDIPGVA